MINHPDSISDYYDRLLSDFQIILDSNSYLFSTVWMFVDLALKNILHLLTPMLNLSLNFHLLEDFPNFQVYLDKLLMNHNYRN